jgi:hypothetical protein
MVRRRARLVFALCIVAVLRASASEEDDNGEQGELVVDDSGLPESHLDLLSMGVGAAGRMINVGLDWKYNSATAMDKMTTPKLRVGHSGAMSSVVHVEAGAEKKVALFTGSDDVQVELTSRSKASVLGMTSGKGRWDVSVPDATSFHVGLSGAKPTVRLVDQKMGVGTKAAPKTSLQIQSNSKGDSLLVQGNIDGKTDGIVDSSITLESSTDGRGRGVFMPHRAGGAAATAWFSGVPQGGGGFQIGSSTSHLPESTSGPYTKKKAHFFIDTSGNIGIGHTAPEGQLDIQLLAGNKKQADRALNVRSGSVNVDLGQGVNSNRVPMITGEQEHIEIGSKKKSQEREIRLQTSDKSFVTVSRYNAFVGIGGVKVPTVPLDVKGSVKVSSGQIMHSMSPKAQEQMYVLNSQTTVPSAIGFRQDDKPYLTISAGKTGATLELANKVSLTVANGKMGIGTDPTELFHVKGGDVLLEGKTTLMFNSKMAGTKLYEEGGMHISGGQAAKIFLEKSDVLVSNAGSNALVRVLSGPAKESAVELMSGSEMWKMHSTMAGGGSLHFSNKGPRITMTTKGQIGVGVAKPTEALHVAGSALLQSTSKPVFFSAKTNSESQPAGLRVTSANEEWRIMTTGAGSKDAAPGSLQFTHGTKTHIVMSKGGALGIGVAAPMAGVALHLKGPSMFDIGKGKGKIVISTPNSNPGMSFFDNAGFRRTDLETNSAGVSFTRGNIGVGAKTPRSKLHVYDAKNSKITISRAGRESTEGYLQYNGGYFNLGTSTSDGVQFSVNKQPKMTMHPNGNVGVGTVIPMSQFQVSTSTHLYQAGDNSVVAGNAVFDGAKFKYTGNGGASAVQMRKDGSVGIFTSSAGSKDMEVAEFGKSRLAVTMKGFVGVGTETPDTHFHVAVATAATLKGHGALMLGGGKSKENMAFDAKTVQARTNGQPSVLRFNPFGGSVELFSDSTKSGQQVTFENSGNIGFGPKKPIAKLHVSEGPGKYATVAIGESPAGAAVIRYKTDKMTLGFSKSTNGAPNKEDAISILKNGYVGVGTASPKSKLHISGDVTVSGKLNVGGKQVVTLMEDMMKENKRLSMELAATKEMLMSMSANMQKMQSTMSEMSATRSDAQ